VADTTKKTRASGKSAGEEVAAEEAAALTEPMEQEVLPEERNRRHFTPGFARMRTEWHDHATVARVHSAVEARIMHNFAEAFQVMSEIYDIVREPVLHADDTPVRDVHGFIVWKRNATDTGFVEDFTKITVRQREHLLFKITTSLFNWEQAAAEAWAEAMYAKAIWEESFAVGFDAPMTGTVDDRRAAGTKVSGDDKYFAVFVSAYSRRADAIVRSMERLSIRLKDVMTS